MPRVRAQLASYPRVTRSQVLSSLLWLLCFFVLLVSFLSDIVNGSAGELEEFIQVDILFIMDNVRSGVGTVLPSLSVASMLSLRAWWRVVQSVESRGRGFHG